MSKKDEKKEMENFRRFMRKGKDLLGVKRSEDFENKRRSQREEKKSEPKEPGRFKSSLQNLKTNLKSITRTRHGRYEFSEGNPKENKKPPMPSKPHGRKPS